MANKIDYKKVLGDFIADIDTKQYTDEEIFGAYPEFNNDKALLDAAYQYANTVKANKYDEQTLQSKFPEFFDAAQPTEQPQPAAQEQAAQQPQHNTSSAKESPNAWQTFYKGLGAGAINTANGLISFLNRANSGQIAYAPMTLQQMAKQGMSPEEIARVTDATKERLDKAETERYNAWKAKADQLSAESKPDGGEKTFTDYIAEGKIGKALQLGLGTAAESLPYTASALNPVATAAMIMSMSEQNYRQSLEDNPDMSDGKRIASAVGNAAIEMAVEHIGNPFKVFKAGKLTAPTATKWIKDVVKQSKDNIYKGILRVLGFGAKEAAKEGGEEVITTAGQDLYNTLLDWKDTNGLGLNSQWERAKQANPQITPEQFALDKAEGLTNDFIGGALSGMMMSGPSTGVGLVQNAKYYSKNGGSEASRTQAQQQLAVLQQLSEEFGVSQEYVAQTIVDYQAGKGLTPARQAVINRGEELLTAIQSEQTAAPEQQAQQEEVQAQQPTREDVIRQEVTDEVASQTHKNGYVYPVKQAGADGKAGFIVGDGNVEVDLTDPNKPFITNDDIVTVKYEDGTIEQVSARMLDLVSTPEPADNIITGMVEQRLAAEAQQAATEQAAQNLPEGVVEFTNGNETMAVVDNGDGTYQLLNSDGTLNVNSMTADQLADIGYAMIPREQAPQAPVQQVQAQPIIQEPQQPVVPAQPAQPVQPTKPQEPDFNALSAGDYAAAAVEYMGSRERVAKFLDMEIKAAENQLKAAEQKTVTRYNGMADFNRQQDLIDQEIQALQQRVAKLKEAKDKAASYLTVAEREQMAKAETERQAAAEAARIAREQAAAEAAAKAEQERIDRELKKGVPDFVEDNDKDARARGFHVQNGVVIRRQEPLQPLATGKATTVQFAKGDNGAAEAHHVLIPVSQAQPSHINGQRNPAFFISEAQPKDRRDQVSKVTSDMMAQNIHPDEIVEGATAYVGAPVLNSHGEAVQGNNRLDALIKMYQSHPESVAKYKQYLIDNAAALGYTEADIETIKNNDVIDVRMLDNVTDEQAIQLGQKKATDLETGGVQLIDPQVTASQLGDKIQRFSEVLLKSEDDEATLADLVLRNGKPALEYLQRLGIINDAQMQSAFDSRGNITAEAKAALQGVLKQVLFQNVKNDNLPILFDAIPLTAQKAILQTIVRDLQTKQESRLAPHLQEAIVALRNAMVQSEEVRFGRTEAEIRAAMRSWAAQMQISDDFEAENFVPSEKFSNFALELATLLRYGKQKEIANKLNQYYDAAQGTVDMFRENPAVPFEEAVQQVFGLEYKSAEDVQREKTRKEIQTYLESIADEDHPFDLFDDAGAIELMRRLGASDEMIARMQIAMQNGRHLNGIKAGGRIYLNIDECTTTEKARTNYVHERQHLLTTKEQLERVYKAADYNTLNTVVDELTGRGGFYLNRDWAILADEFISFGMEVAYDTENDAELEAVLMSAGANDALINIIKDINNEQRLGQNQSLNKGRRVRYDNGTPQRRSQSLGTNTAEKAGGVDGQGSGIDTSSRVGTGDGGTREGSSDGTGLPEEGSGSVPAKETAGTGDNAGVAGANRQGSGNGEVTPGEKTPKPIGESNQNPHGKAPQTPTGSEKAAEIEKVIADFKKQYPDPNVAIFFRNGKTYDIYGEDAVKAAEILGVEPTEKDGMPFVSFPTEDVGTNLRKFIAKGVKVGIASHPAHKPSKGDYQQGDKFTWEGKEAIIKGFTHFGTAIVEVDGTRRELSREQLDDILDYGDYMYHVGDVVTYNGKRAQIVEFASGDPVIEVEGESEKRYVSFSDIERVKKETPTETPSEEEQQQAAQYLNEALQEVISKSGDKLPQNITIDENTIEDNPDSVEMTARLLIDGKPSDFSVTIFDQSLGARGGFDPVNMVKFYPREELDKWDWDLADRLAEEFNKTRTQGSGLATVMDESDAVYFFNMQAALDFAEKARQEIAPTDNREKTETRATEEAEQEIKSVISKKTPSSKKSKDTLVEQTPKNSEKIEDVGEKIGGARKDIIQDTVDRINVNGDTFAKIFPKFDYHKLITNGLEPRMAAGLKYVCEHAKKTYKIRKKRFGDKNALEATRFMANYAKGYLLGDTSLDFTSEGWVFTAYGKRRYEFGIKLWESLREAMGDSMFDVDLSGYDCDIIPTEEERRAEAVEAGRKFTHSTNVYYRRNADGESVEFTPRYEIITPKGDKLFTAEEYDEAVKYFQDQVTSAINYQAANPFELSVYRKRTSDDCCVHAKIGGKWVELTPWGKEYGLKYRDEHRAELQAMAQRKAEELKEQRKNTRPEAKVEVKWFSGVEDVGSYRIATKIGKEYVPISEPMPVKDIWKYAREHHDELQAKAQELLNAYLDQQEADRGWKPQLNIGGLRNRVGTDWRNGADVTAERFRQEFGFRGVEFGNYVTQKERQRLLNECFDALHDMAEILGVSPRALSLNGQLGFAIGARGGAGAKAHYEPGKNVINLTKKNGWGAIAHEWWHAMDYYFGRRDKERPATGGVFNENTRKEMQDAFAAVMNAINGSEYMHRSQALDAKTNKRYYAEDTELGARAFEDYIAKQLIERGQVNDFLSHHTAEEDWNGDISNYPYPIEKDGVALADAFQAFFDTVEERTDEATGNQIMFSVSRNTLTTAARDEMQQIKDAALADGTFMKAPNGKRSNLNERQWLQVRTRAFQRMFGDWQNDPENATKVLDENGEPMVMYHGTWNDFTTFDKKKIYSTNFGKGFYFISDMQKALSYGHYLMPVFLNVRKPLDLTTGDNDAEYNKWYGKKKNPYDGYTFIPTVRDANYTMVVVPNPNQIKSAIDNDGSFSEENDDIRFSVSNASEEIFFSNAERAVESIKQEKATPAQWLAMIEKAGGLKAGEDKWIGLSDWLKAQHATVEMQPGETRSQYIVRLGEASKKFTISKQDILDYIRQNKIQIEEEQYGDVYDNPRFKELEAEFSDVVWNIDDILTRRWVEADNNLANFYDEMRHKYGEDFLDQLNEHEQSVERYLIDAREEFNHEVPQDDDAFKEMVRRYGDDFEQAFWSDGTRLFANENDAAGYYLENKQIESTRMKYTTEGLKNKREIALVVPTIESWNQGDAIHFGDAGEGRAVAWVRFGDTDRTLVDGRDTYANVLVIDEIQSKRHQEGRDKGYRYQPKDQLMKEWNDAGKRRIQLARDWQAAHPNFTNAEWYAYANGEEYQKAIRDEQEAEERLDKSNKQIPAAPFEKNWQELAMKRMLRFAAENDYDKVAWTTGEQQANRYDLGKKLEEMSVVYNDETGLYDVFVTEKGGDPGEDSYRLDEGLDDEGLRRTIGKDLYNRVMEEGKQYGWDMPVTLTGDDLIIGVDGMKGFYDDMLPRFMQKYGKKWGVQVGEVTMPDLEQGYQTMHSVDITPEMRESVLQGQPMFSVTGSRGTMDAQPGENKVQYAARIAEEIKRENPKDTSLDEAIRFSITVNHNSPYLLKRADGAFVDPETGERLGFDLRFIGKGEGGQAHGYGSYFSKNDIRSYAEGGNPIAYLQDTFDTSRWRKFGMGDAFYVAGSYMSQAANERARSLRKWLEDKLADSKALLERYKDIVVRDPQENLMVFRAEADLDYIPSLLEDMKQDADMRLRHHYSVEIPDDNGSNYLEEGKAPVRILRKLVAAMTDEQKEFIASIPVAKTTTGEEIIPKDDIVSRIQWLIKNSGWRDAYDVAEVIMDSPKKASEWLNELGFVGIHYDGRRDGECYVIFNPDDAVITDHIRFSVTGGSHFTDRKTGLFSEKNGRLSTTKMAPTENEDDQIRFSVKYDPRGSVPKVRGGWTKEKILRYLKQNAAMAGTGKGMASRLISEFDSPAELKDHMFYHGTVYGPAALKPSITMSERDAERYGGGGYGDRYWGISLTKDKKIASNFSGTSRSVKIYPVILAKNANVIERPDFSDAYDLEDHIVELWEQGVDAVWISEGKQGKGEQELCVLNPRAICVIDRADWYDVYNMANRITPLKIVDDEHIEKMYNAALEYQQRKYDKPRYKGHYPMSDEFKVWEIGITPEERAKRRAEYEAALQEYRDGKREFENTEEAKAWRDYEREVDDTIRFSVNNPSTLSRSETVTKALVQQANNNYNIMQSALKKVTADLKGIRAAMRMQSDYDRKVVDSLLNLYNTLLQENGVWAQYMPDTTRRIATQIVHAIGKQNITEEVNTIMDHMVHAQAKAAQRQWDKLRQTPIDKINISGVVMQGKVALEGQHALKAMNDALQANMTIEQIEEQINQLMDMEDNATDESLKTQYKGQWIGLTIAAQHLERLQHLQEERQQLDLELQSARSNKALKPAARQQLVDNIKQAMRDNYIEQAEAYTRSTQDLSEYVNTQEGRAKDFIRRQDANRDKIRSYAQRDLEGLATNPNRNRTKGNVARSIWDAFASPIRDLQSLLRLTGLHAPDGEGYLYNHFMRNWMDGADMERTGIVAASKTLDEKIAELTNGKYKTWEEAARKINDASHNMFGITMLNGVDGKDMPVTEEIPLNAGNALYIYAVNKMNDGRMKLNGMNITEEDVQALADKVREQFGQEILDVVDWVQSEFFSQLRNRYNPTHEALFGAPMDAIENYFPLRINANARQQNEDLSEPDTDAARLLAGTSTGAIKRRTRNSLPLDVRNADFFQEVIRHISQMERWNAFAQWNRDANILFSDINFRNRIKGMKGTIYGEGDKLYNYMKDAFRVAIGTYKPKTDTFSEITLNMAKGVTSAKINFRIFTALKQIASFPAFFTYMQDGVFVGSYLRNWLKPHETMKWAKENLPNFEKRVSKRDMGDMRLMQRSTDWQWNKRILEWSSKYGMFFNVFFDTLTCATGARAVYDSHLADYMKKGYSEEDARNRARQDAEQAFNTSQQSSEGAFMSAVQQDRNLVTAALTVFRTSPIQYTRNFFYHTRNLLRKFGEGKRDEQIAFRMGQYKNDGLNDEQARKAAEKDYNKSLRQDIVGFVVYGALLNILWRLAGQIPYLLLGDDDDKKKQILDDATSGGAWFSPFTGLLGGGIVESALDGNGSVADMFAPEMPFTQDIKRAGQYLSNDKYAEFASQALSVLMQSGTGFDPLTASDMVSRIVTTLDSEEELDAATQALRVSQALLSIPQSQYEQMLIDKVVSGETDEDAALEDFVRYYKVHRAPLTFFLRNEENDIEAEENAAARFNMILKDRDKLHNPEDYEE